MKVISSFILLYLLLVAFPAAAQLSDVILLAPEIPIPGRTVYDVVQDDLWFRWFAYDGGLVRYDGVDSRLYPLEEPPSHRARSSMLSRGGSGFHSALVPKD